MASEQDWHERAKGLLKAEMKRRNLTYDQLSERLAAIGIQDSGRNLRNKVSRGGFSAAFLLQCLRAVGCTTVHLDDE